MTHASPRPGLHLLLVLFFLVLGSGAVLAQGEFSVLFEDRFDGTSDLWTVRSGAWTEESGAPTSHHLLAAELAGGHPAWQDVRLHVELELLEDLGLSGRTVLYLRRQGQWQGYGLIVGAGGVELVRFDGEPRQYQVLARSDRTLTVGEKHHLRVDVEGRRMTVYLDGAPVMQGMDPVNTYRMGEIGIRTEGAAVRLYAVRVEGPPGSPTVDATWRSGLTERDRILASFPEFAPSGLGYHPPGSDTAAGARNIMLIYTHGKRWNHVDALPYVAYGELVREIGQLPRLDWHDWFFDTFLFLALLTEDKARAYDSATRAAPANWDDWTDFLHDLFAPNGHLAAFDQAIDLVKESLDDPDYRARVIVMIPYPEVAQTNFGDPVGTGRSLDFSFPNAHAAEDRYAAVSAYMDKVLEFWEQAEYEHLDLIGFYWLAESVRSGDETLIRQTAERIHAAGHRFFWIPYFSAAGYDRWESLGFDVAIYQPNYMFNTSLPKRRLHDAALRAYSLGMGVEIEADWTILSTEAGRERYRDYLWAGLKYGFMEESIRAYYLEQDLMGPAYLSTDPDVRAVYDDTYRFVTGEFGSAEPSS